jgi:RNA polymerase sigma-70 factor, ECF subfamily
MPKTPVPDTASAAAIDPQAWPERYGDLLYRMAFARCRDAEAAADLVQETFLAGLKARAGFRGEARESTWLVGILKHKLLDHFRRTGRGSPTLPAAASPFDDDGWWAVEPGTWTGGPDMELSRREFWETLEACVGSLPLPLAEAFSLHELEERPGPEVCQALGIAATNLWTRLYRARLLLRACLEQRWFGGPAPGAAP